MAKKILKVLVRIVGAFLLLFGILAFVAEVCTCVLLFSDGFGDWKMLLFPLAAVLIIYIGWKMLLLKKTTYYVNKFKEYIRNREQILYQKEQKRHAKALERADQMTIARNNAIADGTYVDIYEKKKQKYLKSIKPDYVDKPLANRKQEICTHFCPTTDTVWKVLRVILLLLAAGTLVTIPVFCKVLPSEYLLLYVCIASVIFWGSLIMAAGAKGHVDSDSNIVFVTTDQKLLYKFDLNTMFIPMTDIPISKIGRIIYYHKKMEENEEVQKKIDTFLENRAVVEDVIEKTVNPSKNDDVSMEVALKKLNSPLLKKKLLGTYIKYWDEVKEKWEMIFLPKKTEGYEQICELITSRNR